MNYLIIQWIICYYTVYFDPSVVLDLSIRSLFKLTKLLVLAVSFFDLFLAFWTKKKKKEVSSLSYTFPVPSLESAIFPRGPGFLERKMAIRRHPLSASCTHCYGGVSPHSQSER